jgi:LPXTG-motif cell wall-anchored protein
MTKGYRGILILALVGLFVLMLGAAALANGGLPGMGTANGATGGGLEAAAIGELGDTTVTPPLEKLLDLPALHADCDAEGRVVMDLPALKLVGKPGTAACGPKAAPAAGPSRLPKTGANVGDIFAAGMAALSGGGVLVRRLRFSLAG